MNEIRNNRAVITGLASINPLGKTKQDFIKNIRAGASAAAFLTTFPREVFPCQLACQIDAAALDGLERILSYRDFVYDRKTKIGIATIINAMNDLGCDFPDISCYEKGISLGIGVNDINFQLFVDYFKARKNLSEQTYYKKIVSDNIKTQVPYDYISRWVAEQYDFRGPVANHLSACAAGTQAIGTAYNWVKNGNAKVVITGGVDSILMLIGITSFSLLGVLSQYTHDPKKASRPFDKDRDGFVPGEGAGILVLEEYEHAKARGAQIYGEICGYGSSMDAYKPTAPLPDGANAAIAIKNAIHDAHWNLRDIEYINAHGTSTFLNDIAETKAIKIVFKDLACKIPVSSCKSQFGHLMASSGPVELIAVLLSAQENILPATINLENPDRECDLDYIPKKVRNKKINRFLKNSFAFGGQNATLAVEVN